MTWANPLPQSRGDQPSEGSLGRRGSLGGAYSARGLSLKPWSASRAVGSPLPGRSSRRSMTHSLRERDPSRAAHQKAQTCGLGSCGLSNVSPCKVGCRRVHASPHGLPPQTWGDLFLLSAKFRVKSKPYPRDLKRSVRGSLALRGGEEGGDGVGRIKFAANSVAVAVLHDIIKDHPRNLLP